MSVPFPESDGDTPARLLAEAGTHDNAPALSVSQLSAAIKRTVEDGFARVRVRGELSGAKRAASGHFSGCLKDDNALIDRSEERRVGDRCVSTGRIRWVA